jgi:hypothetical protein
MQTIAIDFDGVIHAYSRGWQDGTIYDEPVPMAFAAIEELRKKYAIAIFTTRDVRQVSEWLQNYGLNVTTEWTPPFWRGVDSILVTNVKPAAVAYIDDRAIRFFNWVQTMSDLNWLLNQPGKIV